MQPDLRDSSAKLLTLKQAILADPVLSLLPNNADSWFQIADTFNLAAVPNFFTWNQDISVVALMQNGFAWDRVDNMTVGKARIWQFMTAAGFLNFNKPNVRAGVNAAFNAAADDNTRLAIFTEAQRLATRAEKLYATGTGSATNNTGVGPAMASNSGQVTSQEVEAALALP